MSNTSSVCQLVLVVLRLARQRKPNHFLDALLCRHCVRRIARGGALNEADAHSRHRGELGRAGLLREQVRNLQVSERLGQHSLPRRCFFFLVEL
jgi:hypothetical protein